MKSKHDLVVASFVPVKLVSLRRLAQTGRRVAVVSRRGLRAGSATLALAIAVMFGIVSTAEAQSGE